MRSLSRHRSTSRVNAYGLRSRLTGPDPRMRLAAQYDVHHVSGRRTCPVQWSLPIEQLIRASRTVSVPETQLPNRKADFWNTQSSQIIMGQIMREDLSHAPHCSDQPNLKTRRLRLNKTLYLLSVANWNPESMHRRLLHLP